RRHHARSTRLRSRGAIHHVMPYGAAKREFATVAAAPAVPPRGKTMINGVLMTPQDRVRVRATASCQPAHLRSRVEAFMRGGKRRSHLQLAPNVGRSGQRPAARPAR